MHVRTYTVTGPGVAELETALSERLNPKASHSGDGFAVLLCEEYELWRTNSNMQATVIIDHESDDTATVKVTVGGGATGLLKLTWGSERKVGKKFMQRIESEFETLGLSVEADSTPTGAP